MDYNEIQFCDDAGYCICGNDCGAGCCTTENPCDGHRAIWKAEREAWETILEDGAPEPVDPWATPGMPPQSETAALWAEQPRPTACGRCEGEEGPEGLMYHLQWKCTAQEAWIEAAINDRQARPDRYRQAKKDLGAKTLTEARALLAARKAN